jgi:hypothetical protein
VKIFNIVHQQIAQLKWHILACFGLVMVLPLEQAVVNFKDGDGFYPDNTMVVPAMLISVLLAGLIGCSNVQADFKEKRYTFWRSKPINAKLFIVLKYFTGLIAALLIVMSPAIFYHVSLAVGGNEPLQPLENIFLAVVGLLALMSYSVCFACNILVRKTARSWLVGLTLTCITLLVPFMLPFNYKVVENGDGAFFWDILIVLAIALALGAFIFAILAADRNWHLKTNLKGLLWVGATLILSLMLLLCTQIANIKVLDQTEAKFAFHNPITVVDGKILLNDFLPVEIVNDQIKVQGPDSLNEYTASRLPPDIKDLVQIDDYRNCHVIRTTSYRDGDDLYRLELSAGSKTVRGRNNYTHIYLLRVKITSGQPGYSSILELTDLLRVNGDEKVERLKTAMRRFDDKFAICINRSLVVIGLSDPDKLTIIDKKPNWMKRRYTYLTLDKKDHPLSLLPIDGVSFEDRAKFTIDAMLGYYIGGRRMSYELSQVDIDGSNIVFAYVDDSAIYKYTVSKHDDKTVHYKNTAVREDTILERVTQTSWQYDTFVRDGRLYASNDHELLVFDIRSGDGIRKLGHFVRGQATIEDVDVFDDGNIMVVLAGEKRINKRGDRKNKYTLTLLKKP